MGFGQSESRERLDSMVWPESQFCQRRTQTRAWTHELEVDRFCALIGRDDEVASVCIRGKDIHFRIIVFLGKAGILDRPKTATSHVGLHDVSAFWVNSGQIPLRGHDAGTVP